LERAQAPSFADLLLAMPQDDGDVSDRYCHAFRTAQAGA
jgi:hypothetical protein